MIGVLSAEWLKMRSVRSTLYIIGVAASCVVFAAVWAWYVAHLWDTLPPERKIRQAAPGEHLAKTVVPFCMAVLGVLAITSEYATGLIRPSLIAAPRRIMMLAAKALVVATLAVTTGLAVMFGAFFVARLIMGDRPIEGYQSALSDEVPMLAAGGASVVLLALVGLGLGALLRSTAATLTAVVVLMFVLPAVAGFLPAPWDDRVSSVMLPTLPGELANYPEAAGVLPPAGALAVMLTYLTVALRVGAIALIRRDA